jgi:hypothetical protein
MLPKLTLKHLACGLLTTLSLTACGAGDDASTSEASSDTFAEAIPDSDALALTLDDGETAADDPNGAALTGQPSELRRLTRGVFEKVNALREATQARVDALLEGVEPTTFTEGNLECKRWVADNAAETTHWQLTSCQKDKKNRHFAFALKGRAVDAADDALVAVMSGEGKVLARFDGKKRGSGHVRFDFDALAALTGEEGPAGKVAIGFRAAGRVRQLNVALRDFAEAGDDTPVSGLYRFKHILQVGGRVSLLAHGDILMRAEDDALVQGTDGEIETVRAALVWNRGRGARAAAAVCGGTVGEDTCERIVQCWRADGVVTHEAADDQAEPARGNGNGHGNGQHARVNWEPSLCPGAAAGLDDIDDAPSADDVELPAGDDLPEEPSPADGE